MRGPALVQAVASYLACMYMLTASAASVMADCMSARQCSCTSTVEQDTLRCADVADELHGVCRVRAVWQHIQDLGAGGHCGESLCHSSQPSTLLSPLRLCIGGPCNLSGSDNSLHCSPS